jgi:NAD-dependent deacetylase
MWFIDLIRSLRSSGPAAQPIAPGVLESTTATTYPLLGHPQLNNAAYWLRQDSQTPRLVIFSGAGLSHESGLSLFRGADGLWDNHRVDEICNGLVWRNFRDTVDAFYEKRWQDNLSALPHDGHRWCAQQEAKGAVLLTQNVDTLLERSGAQHAGHLHGRLDHHRCFACDFRWRRGDAAPLTQMKSCPACSSGDTRIDVVLFHEPAPAYESAHRVLAGLREQDVLLIVGTTTTVFNPLHFLTAPPHVWVVDPDPPPMFLGYPKSHIWRAPASSLASTAGIAWSEHLAKFHEH